MGFVLLTSGVSVYESIAGDKLVDQSLMPNCIRLMLEAETQLLDRLSSQCEVLIELGCMYGRHLDWAAMKEKDYIGVDTSQRYFEIFKSRQLLLPQSQMKAEFVHSSALDAISRLKCVKRLRESALFFFPFNSFGNMSNPKSIFRELTLNKLSFLISTFGVDNEATSCRTEYYLKSGITELSIKRLEERVIVTSRGFRSIAYDDSFFAFMSHKNRSSITSVQLGKVGKAFVSVNA